MAGHVVLIGAGNIGSHLVEHLARMPAVRRITLVDPGTYEATNLQGQRIDRDGVGRAKVDVQAERIRRIDPDVEVVTLMERVQDVPLGRLRGDVIVTGLDGWRARQCVNEAARRLGVPWIDAAVQAEGMLARVNVYSAAEESACLECSWGPRDYDLVEQVRPCAPDEEAPPTNAPSSLGALAAALEAIECEKLLRGEETVLDGRQVMIDARHHGHFLSSFRRNASCRLGDHAPWRIESVEVPDDATLGELIASLEPGASSLEVFGSRCVRAVVCRGCAQRVAALRFGSRRAWETPCPSCGGELVASGFDTLDTLDLASLSSSERARPVRDVGIRAGDAIVLASRSGAIRRCEVSLASHSLAQPAGGLR
jgi:adenylyltransferase/sulfurtransferase